VQYIIVMQAADVLCLHLHTIESRFFFTPLRSAFPFLNALAKFRKRLLDSLCLLSFRPHDFHENWYVSIFGTSVEKVGSKIVKHN
jgi:hypothetical protein